MITKTAAILGLTLTLSSCGGGLSPDGVADKAVQYLNRYCEVREVTVDGSPVKREIRRAMIERGISRNTVDTMGDAADGYCRIKRALDAESAN